MAEIKKQRTSLLTKINLYKLGIFTFKDLRQKVIDNPNYILENNPEFASIIRPVLENEEYQRRKTFEHHANGLSDYDHMLEVSSMAYAISNYLGLDYNQVALGAILHDFYYEDWRAIWYDDPNIFDKHGLMHPIWALENTAFNFPNLINEDIVPMIADHMLVVDGLSPRLHFPRTKAAWVVAVSDGICSLTKKSTGEKQLDASTIGILTVKHAVRSIINKITNKESKPKHEIVHRKANPLRHDFEIKFGNSVLNNPLEPHLKDSQLVTDFALKSKAWHIKSMNLDEINRQFGFFFLHQKYLLEERFSWALKNKMNDTLNPLLEIKEYYDRVLSFYKGEKKISGVKLADLKPETKEIILSTLSDAKIYLLELEDALAKLLDNSEETLKNEEIKQAVL